ncbi:dapb3 [Scenedesmus sp. PABB004]|nr:dapb3 [Scenedesmus sp. PABB004]
MDRSYLRSSSLARKFFEDMPGEATMPLLLPPRVLAAFEASVRPLLRLLEAGGGGACDAVAGLAEAFAAAPGGADDYAAAREAAEYVQSPGALVLLDAAAALGARPACAAFGAALVRADAAAAAERLAEEVARRAAANDVALPALPGAARLDALPALAGAAPCPADPDRLRPPPGAGYAFLQPSSRGGGAGGVLKRAAWRRALERGAGHYLAPLLGRDGPGAVVLTGARIAAAVRGLPAAGPRAGGGGDVAVLALVGYDTPAAAEAALGACLTEVAARHRARHPAPLHDARGRPVEPLAVCAGGHLLLLLPEPAAPLLPGAVAVDAAALGAAADAGAWDGPAAAAAAALPAPAGAPGGGVRDVALCFELTLHASMDALLLAAPGPLAAWAYDGDHAFTLPSAARALAAGAVLMDPAALARGGDWCGDAPLAASAPPPGPPRAADGALTAAGAAAAVREAGALARAGWQPVALLPPPQAQAGAPAAGVALDAARLATAALALQLPAAAARPRRAARLCAVEPGGLLQQLLVADVGALLLAVAAAVAGAGAAAAAGARWWAHLAAVATGGRGADVQRGSRAGAAAWLDLAPAPRTPPLEERGAPLLAALLTDPGRLRAVLDGRPAAGLAPRARALALAAAQDAGWAWGPLRAGRGLPPRVARAVAWRDAPLPRGSALNGSVLDQAAPKFRNPQLSPDGRYLAYIRPSGPKEVYNVFIKTLGVSRDLAVTSDTGRGVSAYSWAEDSSSILYIQDTNGDENDHLYMVSLPPLNASSSAGGAAPAAGPAVNLTPFPGVKAAGIVGSKRFPRRLYVGLNRRDRSVFDLYSVDLDARSLSLDTVNPGEVTSWLFDYDFRVKGAVGYDNNNGASYVLIRDGPPPPVAAAPGGSRAAVVTEAARTNATRGGGGSRALEALFAAAAARNFTTADWIAASVSRANAASWRRLLSWPYGEEGGVFRVNKAGDGLYVVSSLGRDTTELQLVGLGPGAPVRAALASHPLVNVGSVLFDPDDWNPQLVSFTYLRTDWTILDAPAVGADWGRLSAWRGAGADAEASILDISNDRTVWLVMYASDRHTSRYYLYTRGAWPPALLFEVQPGLNAYKLAPMHPVIIPARDGLRLPSYLTLPLGRGAPAALPPGLAGAPPAGTTRVNYRGSSGFGKNFLNAGDKQWGIGRMQHDLTDAVAWAVRAGVADPARVAIAGGSYGGYATLAGLAFTPSLYACGVDLVGISNVATFQASIPEYWKVRPAPGARRRRRTTRRDRAARAATAPRAPRASPTPARRRARRGARSRQPLRYEWLTRVGDAEGNATFNAAISPVFHVANITAPLLIGQGAADPRVPRRESDQIFAALTRAGRKVSYVLYPDEGHGLVRHENRLDFYGRADAFLATCLGGRSEPFAAVPGSSAEVIAAMV